MIFIVFGLVYLCFLVWTTVSICSSLLRDKEETGVFFPVSKVFYVVLAPFIGFCRYDAYGSDIPFAKEHVGIIILLVTTSILAFWSSYIIRSSRPYIIKLLLAAGMIQGIVLSAIISVHFITYMGQGLIFPLFGFELVAPPMVCLLFIHRLYFFSREVLPIGKSFDVPGSVILLLIIIVMVQVAGMSAAGADLDAAVKAFSESRGFIFSNGTNYTPPLQIL